MKNTHLRSVRSNFLEKFQPVPLAIIALFHFFPIPQFFGADRDFAQSILVCDVGLKIAAVGTDVIHAFNFLEVHSDLSQFVGLEIYIG